MRATISEAVKNIVEMALRATPRAERLPKPRARFVRALDARGVAALYALETPMQWRESPGGSYPRDALDRWASMIVVSASVVPYSGPETYVFPVIRPVNRLGRDGFDAVSWLEIGPSQRGTLSHQRVLEEAGYQVVWGESDDSWG